MHFAIIFVSTKENGHELLEIPGKVALYSLLHTFLYNFVIEVPFDPIFKFGTDSSYNGVSGSLKANIFACAILRVACRLL
jgi:hypothetical protein